MIYEYPMSGSDGETVAILDGSRRVTINVQYSRMLPHSDHTADCPQLVRMGGTCTCPANADIMARAEQLIAHARVHGKFGRAAVPAPRASDERTEWRSERGLTLTEEMEREDTIW